MVVKCDILKTFVINTILANKFINRVNMWFKEWRTHGTTVFSQDVSRKPKNVAEELKAGTDTEVHTETH
jgi:hypothetical protein